MLIDTHNHFTYRYARHEWASAVQQARKAGVAMQVMMPGNTRDFALVSQAAHELGLSYMLGLHPLGIHEVLPEDQSALARCVKEKWGDPRLIGIGEIGLDRFMAEPDFEKQKALFAFELSLAQTYRLPVSVHSRRALSFVLDMARSFPEVRGVLHAFKGSLEQTRQALDLGWKLGIGGAVTYPGSKAVRAALVYAPAQAWVLETDAPDMAPMGRYPRQSSPLDLLSYVQVTAQLKNLSSSSWTQQLLTNTLEVFPRLAKLPELALD